MLQQHALGESVVSGKTQNDEKYEEEGGPNDTTINSMTNNVNSTQIITLQ